MKWFNEWLQKRKAKQIAKKKEEDEYYAAIGKVHSDYINETGKQPTEFRLKMYRHTDDFNEWMNKKTNSGI